MSKLKRVLPVRPTNKGRRAGITGEGGIGPDVNDEESWTFPRNVTLTKIEQKMILAEGVRIGVLTIFRTHVYSFGGHIYHQTSGGPIGLRATGAVAMVRVKLDNSNIKTMVDARYV